MLEVLLERVPGDARDRQLDALVQVHPPRFRLSGA